MRTRVLALFTMLLLSPSLNIAQSKNEYDVLKETCGLYQIKREYQDVDGKRVEINNPYGEGKLKVKKTDDLRTIIGLGTEKNTDIPDIQISENAFPLTVESKWADSDALRNDPGVLKREDKMYFNYVEKIEDVTTPAGTFKNCLKIVYKSLPDDVAEWYCPNTGIVKIEYHHHGTIDNWIVELKKSCN